MAFSMLKFAIPFFVAGSQAFQAISVPSNITAGQPFTLDITTNSSDADYSTYRVYLDTTPPGYTGGPSCWLKNNTLLGTTNLSLTIPADLGPDGSYYSVITLEMPASDPTSYTYSNSFNLTGATGNWSAYEDNLNGTALWPADDLPCSAYGCARKCAMASYPDDETYGSDAYKTMSSCIVACPDVSEKSTTTSSSAASGTAAAGSAAAATSTSSAAAAAAVATGVSGLGGSIIAGAALALLL